jgi:hypothetical protein
MLDSLPSGSFHLIQIPLLIDSFDFLISSKFSYVTSNLRK